MRIATWNINGLRARLEFVRHWLDARRPDLVGLQELKVDAEQFPAEVFEEDGYHTLAHCQKAWNGVAILSRQPLELVQEGLPGEQESGARMLCASTAGLAFATVYVPNGKSVRHPDFQEKLRWLDTLHEWVARSHDPGDSLVVCGDFNLCPAPIDSWNEKYLRGSIFHTDEERDRNARLQRWGLRDVFRDRHPDTPGFSWWDYRAGAFHRNQGLRIDLLLATSTLASRVREVQVDRDYRKKKDGMIASDHAPVIADLDD